MTRVNCNRFLPKFTCIESLLFVGSQLLKFLMSVDSQLQISLRYSLHSTSRNTSFPTDLSWALAGARLSLLTAYQIFDVSDVCGSVHRTPSTAASQPISATSLVNHTTFVCSTVLQETLASCDQHSNTFAIRKTLILCLQKLALACLCR